MKVLSLFSGIGGLDLAAEWAGMEVVAQCEIDPYCQSVLKRHWPHVRLFDDIRVMSNVNADLICGGFPCQPVSSAGKRRGKADDRWLWPEMLRVIREIQPAWVVGENVAGLISMGLDGCISDLEEAGYSVQAFVIPACAVNALHRRDRVFIVAYSESAGNEREIGDICAANGRQGRTLLRELVGASGGIVAHAERGGQSGSRRDAQPGNPAPEGNRQASDAVHASAGRERQTLSRMGDMADGLPAWMAGGWTEPVRLKEREPGRVNKLRALGNAVVPAQAYPIFKAIMDCA